jgi:ABC-type lipoprotein release transport system permease subunit
MSVGGASMRVLARLSWRSLVTHRVKTGIVGGIMFFGSMLLVVGLALLDSLEASMQRSVTGSVTGDFQVQSSGGQDQLAIFGGQMTGQDIGEILHFRDVKEPLAGVENVKAVVPMGTVQATVFGRNDLDRVLESLRASLRAGDAAAVEANHETLVQLLDLLLADLKNSALISSNTQEIQDKIDAVARAQAPEFWADLLKDPEPNLRFLDTKIAPLASDGKMYYVRALGTDLALFARSFAQFEVVDGTAVPEGRRGLMLNKGFQEEWLKHFVARGFDTIEKGRKEGLSIATDDALRTRAVQNQRQSGRILYQLSPKDAAALTAELRAFLGSDADLRAMLSDFLDLNDENFSARYDFFYKTIAPKIRLYELPVGETITLRAVTQNGTMKAIPVKVYGTYQLKGLEESKLASAFNLIDLVSFRDLYGLMTDEQRAELSDIREDANLEVIDRASAEDALFGGDADPSASDPSASDPSSPDTPPRVTADPRSFIAATAAADPDKPFTQADIDDGLILHAAIILDDPDLAGDTQAALQAVIDAKNLPIKLIDWQSASGLVGQFVTVIRLVLYVAITIIFLVALIIINNAMLMATMDRIPEIGTMRAIGAQRSFILWMVLLETVTLGLIAGTAGTLAGVGIISWLHSVGIRATEDILVFLFSGPRLYPTVGISQVLISLGVILLVSIVSTLYPARIATRVQPTEAMRSKE